MPYSAGSAYLQVIPSFLNVEAQLRKMAQQLGAQLGKALPASVGAGRGGADGDAYGGAFAAAVRKSLDEALRAFQPDIKLDADSTAVERRIAEIRAQLEELRTQRIGIDLDEGEALAQLRLLQAELRSLTRRQDVSVQVRVDALAAFTALSAVKALEDEVDRGDPTVKVDSQGAVQGLSDVALAAQRSFGSVAALVGVGLSLGTVLVPAAAAAAAAIGAIGTAAAGAGAGIAVTILGFTGISNAVQSLNKESTTAGKSTGKLADTADRVASAHDAIASSADQAASAQTSLASAQRGLIRAEEDEKEALAGLVRAREEAARQQQDMVADIRDNALAQRQAILDVGDAKKALDKLLANPRATAQEREQAQITWEEKKNQLSDLQVRQQRLAADKAAADKAGIEGSQQVEAAQKRLRNAVDSVTAAHQSVASAQRGVEAATRSAAAAQRQLAAAYKTTGTSGSAAADKVKQAFTDLSPEGARFAKFIFGLKGAFVELRNTAQAGMLPGVQAAITELLPYLPLLKRFIADVATEAGRLAVRFADVIQTGPFAKFTALIGNTTVPTMESLFTVGENITRGLLNLFLALTPFNRPIGGGLSKLAADFAHWSENLDHDAGFRHFLAYVRENGPRVVELVKDLVIFVARFVAAAAPVGAQVLRGVTAVVEALNSIPLADLTKVVAVIAALSGGMLTFVGVMKVYRVVAGLAQGVTNLFSAATERLRGGVSSLRVAFAEARAQAAAYNTATGASATTTRSLRGVFTDAAAAISSRYNTALETTVVRAGGVTNSLTGVRAAATTMRSVFTDAAAAISSRYNTALETATIRAGGVTNSLTGLRAAGILAKDTVTSVAGGLQNAAARSNILSGAMTGLRTTTNLLKGGMSSLVSFLGGPWGVAFAVATIGIGLALNEMQKEKDAVREVKGELQGFADTLRDGVTPASLASAQALLAQNKDLRGLVEISEKAGISQRQLVGALNGEAGSRQIVINAIQKQIDATRSQLETTTREDHANQSKQKALQNQIEQLTALRIAFAKTNTEQAEATKLAEAYVLVAFGASAAMVQQAHATDLADEGTRKYLIDLQVMGDKTQSLTNRVSAYREVLDALQKTEQDKIESTLSYQQAVVNSRTAIKGLQLDTSNLTKAEITHARALDGTTQSAIDQEQALIGRAKAIRDGYLADLESGKPEQEAYDRMTKRTAALVDEYTKAGFDRKAVLGLAGAWTTVPRDARTAYTTTGLPTTLAGLTALIGQIAFAQYVAGQITFAQYKQKVDAAKTEAKDDLDLALGRYNVGPGAATGGLITGPGTGTSDDVPYWLSNREFVHKAAAVRHYGVDFMNAINQMRVPADVAQALVDPQVAARVGADVGFAQGGLVTFPVHVDDAKIAAPGIRKVKALLALAKAAQAAGLAGGSIGQVLGTGGGLGTQTGPGGWQWQMRVLRQVFPGLELISGYRPGAITVTGNRSYHAIGRAVDIPPNPSVFEWIRGTYGASTKELIYTPKGMRQVWNGKPHIFNPAVAAEHYCVPTTVPILTRRGWLLFDQVRVGDETPALNLVSGGVEWSTVLDVTVFHDAPVVEVHNRAWRVQSTPEHRWVAYNTKTGDRYWTTTGSHPTGSGITTDPWVVAGVLADGPGLPISAGEAELLGWFLADHARGTGGRGEPFVLPLPAARSAAATRLRRLLGPKVVWDHSSVRVNTVYGLGLLYRAGLVAIPDVAGWWSVLAAMTGAQRQAVLDGVVGAAGAGPGRRVMCVRGDLLPVVTTLGFLCGMRVAVVAHHCTIRCGNHPPHLVTVALGRPRIIPRHREAGDVVTSRVWCPTTVLGSWTARFGDHPTLTGNSHVHWAYDEGGMLPPGWSQVYNGTQQPEPVLNAAQWQQMRQATQVAGGPGNTYNFAFRDTTLTPSKLRSLQDAEAITHRANRRN